MFFCQMQLKQTIIAQAVILPVFDCEAQLKVSQWSIDVSLIKHNNNIIRIITTKPEWHLDLVYILLLTGCDCFFSRKKSKLLNCCPF